MNKTVTFDGAAPAGTINFGIGQPSADLLPDQRFLESLAGFLTKSYGVPTSSNELFVTGGNSQALDLVSVVFANPGDTVFVEEPSYFLAFQIFRDHGLNIVGIPVDDDGLSVDALEKELKTHKPAFLYTIPSYHNPGGQCTTGERMSDSERVLSLGSFSKILAPGLRLGWVQTSERLRERLKSHGFVNSGGSINHISSLIVRQAIDSGSLDSHIEALRHSYRSRVEAMDEALHEHFDGIAKWTRPNGGYFFWLEFDEAVDTGPQRKKARELEAGFQSGDVFSSCGRLKHCLRLSFAHYSEDDIREGIARLRPLFNEDE